MKLSPERALVYVSLMIFLGFGLWLFTIPEALEGIGITMLTPEARIDIRATYGGMELGFCVFLVLCLTREGWLKIGLTASGCVIAGFGGARLLAIVLEGEGTAMMWFFTGIEFVMAAVIFGLLRRKAATS